MLVLALAAPAFGFSPSAGGLSSAPRVARHAEPRLAFKNAQSTDTAVKDQLARAQAAGLTPIEYEKATRATATAYLAESGAHVADASTSDGPRQTAAFLKQLWGVDSVPAVPAAQLADETRVLATLYEIGGPLTNVLSTSVAKELPLIPHLGIRVHGKEYFYSDHIECRTVPVMEEMLGDKPRVTIDLGASKLSLEEVEAEILALEDNWTAEDYHVFDKNCVHFGVELAKRTCESPVGYPAELAQGAIDVSERMLDSLPEWRQALGRRVMNEVTRLVVVSWGKASKAKKEQVADNLGLERGE